jgi:hypothetical protein
LIFSEPRTLIVKSAAIVEVAAEQASDDAVAR